MVDPGSPADLNDASNLKVSNMKKRIALSIASVALLAGVPASAATIVNGDFELGTSPGSYVTVTGGNSTAITGWTVGGASVDYIGSYWTANDGVRSIDLAGNGIGSISQVLDTAVGQSYKVSFFVSRNPDGGLTPRYGFVDTGGTATQFAFGNGGSSRQDMAWEERTYNFVATSTSTTLTFTADPSTSASFYGAALDSVSISAVPEPATWGFMILGFGMVGGAMRRRSQTGSAALRISRA